MTRSHLRLGTSGRESHTMRVIHAYDTGNGFKKSFEHMTIDHLHDPLVVKQSFFFYEESGRRS